MSGDSGNGTRAPQHSALLDLLNERLRFESLLARLSATFINLPPEQVDSQIERGLRQIVEFLGIERSSLGQFSEDGNQLLVTHSYAVGGYPPAALPDLAKTWPWYTARIRRGGGVLRPPPRLDLPPRRGLIETTYPTNAQP